jgi:hypothetical protein
MSDTNKFRTWTYGLRYQGDDVYLELYRKRDAAEFLELIVTCSWVEWLLFRLPGGFLLWEKAVFWIDSQQETILSLLATPEMRKALDADDFGWKEGNGDAEPGADTSTG